MEFRVVVAGMVLGLAWPVGGLAAPSLPIAPQYARNRDRAPAETVAKAAKFLADRQGSWTSHEGLVLEGWEWRVGSGGGAANISGIVGLGLLDAWEATGEAEYLVAARLRADAVAFSLKGGESPYAPDLELLARVARVDGDTERLAVARQSLDQRLEKAGGAEAEARRIVALRAGQPDLAGYDVALVAEAAAAVGRTEAAKALVRTALATSRTWLKTRGSTFGLISEGALCAAASSLGEAQAARELAVSLLASQLAGGEWRARETQATAYATRGLAAFATAFQDASAAKASARGRAWLQLTQLKNGSWADYNDFLPEPFVGEVFAPATAEALRAVVALRTP